MSNFTASSSDFKIMKFGFDDLQETSLTLTEETKQANKTKTISKSTCR
jgi:hypothetical protein